MARTNGGRITDRQLVAYLQFYDIGAELIEECNGQLFLIMGKELEAERLLYKHLCESPGSGGVVSP